MVTYHVYSVSVFYSVSEEGWTELITAMNTGEARDMMKRVYPRIAEIERDEEVDPVSLTWHIHELTRFNVEGEHDPFSTKGFYRLFHFVPNGKQVGVAYSVISSGRIQDDAKALSDWLVGQGYGLPHTIIPGGIAVTPGNAFVFKG